MITKNAKNILFYLPESLIYTYKIVKIRYLLDKNLEKTSKFVCTSFKYVKNIFLIRRQRLFIMLLIYYAQG